MRRIALACLVLLTAAPLLSQAPPAPAPVWVTITAESSTIEVTLPAGTTYRFGDYTNGVWSASTRAPELGVTFDPVSMASGNPFPFADPDFGVAKELDVLEIAGPQTVTVSDLTLSPAGPIQRIIPGLVPPTALATPPGSTHVLTLTNVVIAPGTLANALMLTLTNAPPNLANRTWVGTQMELDIDGVALTCTVGQTYTDQTYTLICAVPVAPTQ